MKFIRRNFGKLAPGTFFVFYNSRGQDQTTILIKNPPGHPPVSFFLFEKDDGQTRIRFIPDASDQLPTSRFPPSRLKKRKVVIVSLSQTPPEARKLWQEHFGQE